MASDTQPPPASSPEKSTAGTDKQRLGDGSVLIWLDDSAEEDPNAKAILSSLFGSVLTLNDAEACLDLVESSTSATPHLAVLVSGKYGQMLVRDRFQPLNQVKDIYVYCMDIAKHHRWAQTCDKVRCVHSDFSKILQRMQYDLQNNDPTQNSAPQQQQQQEIQPREQPVEEQQQDDHLEEREQQRERFCDENNVLDQVALTLLLNSPDDGAEDFADYCRTHGGDGDQNDNDKDPDQHFKPEQVIGEWYKPESFLANLNSNDLSILWTLRWFVRAFHRQLNKEHEQFVKQEQTLTVYHGTKLSTDELNAMKHRISQTIIVTELLITYADRTVALETIENQQNNINEQFEHKIIFEINVNPRTRITVPFAEIKPKEVLFWCGARFRLVKIEFIDPQDDSHNAYWLIGLNLCATLDSSRSTQTLFDFYCQNLTELNDVHYAFGRLFMYKGFYRQAETWLQSDNHHQELAELALRRGQYERANQHLEQLPDDSPDADLLRAYVSILSSNNGIGKGRSLFMKICSEATDRLVRARANIGLGFINLIAAQQVEQALEHFTLGYDVLRKVLPDSHPDIAKALIATGYVHFARRNVADIRRCFEMAFTMQQQSLSHTHPDMAKGRSALAHHLSIDKRTVKQALNQLEQAHTILMHEFHTEHQHHPEILATMQDIDRLRKGKNLRVRNSLLDYI